MFLRLTTSGRKTGKPHLVELRFALADGKIYLSHDGKSSDWVKNLKKNAWVSVEVGSLTFDAIAKIVPTETPSRDVAIRVIHRKFKKPSDSQTAEERFSIATIVEVTPLLLHDPRK